MKREEGPQGVPASGELNSPPPNSQCAGQDSLTPDTRCVPSMAFRHWLDFQERLQGAKHEVLGPGGNVP